MVRSSRPSAGVPACASTFIFLVILGLVPRTHASASRPYLVSLGEVESWALGPSPRVTGIEGGPSWKALGPC